MRLSLHLAAADPVGLRALADAGATQLDRDALARRIAQPDSVRAALTRWLPELEPRGLGALRWEAEVDRSTLARLLDGAGATQLLARRRLSDAAARELVPASLREAIVAVELGPSGAPAPSWILEPPAKLDPPEPTVGVTPSDLVRGYDLDLDHDGAGETIAVMALGGLPAASDVHGFARAFGLSSPRVEIRPLTRLGACANDPNCRFETTMGVEWLCALAPAARVIVYVIDPSVVADPWGTFLAAVLEEDPDVTIAVTSWSAPARQYYAVHGREHIASLLDQAAVAGVTVIAASGDWGAYDGFPSAGPQRAWCDDLGPHDTFPGAEPRVLSVGGTRVVALDPWREEAWSAPVSDRLGAAIGLRALAGSGSVSRHHPLPAYQRPFAPASFDRSLGAPAMPASGRVQPDVSLMAWGPEAAYAALVDGEFRSDAGGTSVAAPIWAGICARLNQARRARGLARLGWLHPRLYSAYAEDRQLLREVDAGATDIVLPIADADGGTAWRRLPGFLARTGLDPATGLGVPRVDRLTLALTLENP